MELASKYNPADVESKWYAYWMKNGFFKSEPDNREPYTIVIPPPNVTGVLHMGHMLNNTIQDILVRRARMLGKNACWVPGTDHASIATEAKVVSKLAEQGIKKTDLTREQFLEHAWEWTHKHGGIILEQLKKLGASCDWDRTAFTMDEKRSQSVLKVFVDLYNKGKIYRGVRMVNWDPKALTALSDEEVIFKEQQGKLFYLKYKIAGENGYAVVATTRPETIMGDTAMCINPNDPKNAYLKGKKVLIPLINREIPVIEDEYVDAEFGTGCLKVTPAHDVNDYMLGEKYNLETIDIFNENGTLNEHGHQYAGMDRFDVRKQIEKDLIAAGLMEKIEDYTNKVGYSERTSVVIEPKLSMQWFLQMEELAQPALKAVMEDTIKLIPPKFKNTYRHWMENVRDWCISRQLWWGHRIPAYYLPQGGYVVAETPEEALEKANAMARAKNISPLQMTDLRQDEDCLDTWFSSWLWPISVFDGINKPENEDIQYYYPTNDLVTAPEILFFWVARMIISGYEYRHEEPFRNVYLTGIVRDKLGRKMSKSLGNSPDPLDLIAVYGADAVRLGMLLTSPAGNDLPYDDSLCEQGRNFNNKIWNAFRLVKGWEVNDSIAQPESAKIATAWFHEQLNKTILEINDCFDKYRISEALMTVYRLFWDEFSSWYLEMVKPAYQQPVDRTTYETTLSYFEMLLKLLHPFMPFITEELYQAIKTRDEKDSIMMSRLPETAGFDASVIDRMEISKEIIAGIRNIRAEKGISPREPFDMFFKGELDTQNNPIIEKLANIGRMAQSDETEGATVTFMVRTTEIAIPVGNNINAEEEIAKMEEEITYLQGFLKSVESKLSNEKFVANAKPEIVENERKKKADAESKIETLKANIGALKK
jgi:valyl-tRNA synthetase